MGIALLLSSHHYTCVKIVRLTSLSLIHKNYDDLISFNLNDKKAELIMLKLITIKTIDFYKSLKERYSEDGKDYPEVMKSIELSIEEFIELR